MMKYHEGKGVMNFYVPKRKSPIAKSTRATADFLKVVSSMKPGATIYQLRNEILYSGNWMINRDAIQVLEMYINRGFADYVPNWR